MTIKPLSISEPSGVGMVARFYVTTRLEYPSRGICNVAKWLVTIFFFAFHRERERRGKTERCRPFVLAILECHDFSSKLRPPSPFSLVSFLDSWHTRRVSSRFLFFFFEHPKCSPRFLLILYVELYSKEISISLSVSLDFAPSRFL